MNGESRPSNRDAQHRGCGGLRFRNNTASWSACSRAVRRRLPPETRNVCGNRHEARRRADGAGDTSRRSGCAPVRALAGIDAPKTWCWCPKAFRSWTRTDVPSSARSRAPLHAVCISCGSIRRRTSRAARLADRMGDQNGRGRAGLLASATRQAGESDRQQQRPFSRPLMGCPATTSSGSIRALGPLTASHPSA